MWKVCLIVCCSGVVLHIGSEVWEYLYFYLRLFRMTGGSNMNLRVQKVRDPAVGKLVPRMMHTARILYAIYLGMTVILFVLLVCGKMSVFESLTTAFSTAGTGGFGIRRQSSKLFPLHSVDRNNLYDFVWC